MHLNTYKATHVAPLSPRTVVFLVKDGQVLLGYKKRGFGKGNFVGIGGKLEENESIEAAAKREITEEIGVDVPEVTAKGTIKFYFPDESWNILMHIFIAKTWDGEPQESEEIKPEWFAFDALPFDKMWDDAKFWIPQVLQGKELEGEYLYDKNLVVIESI